MNMKLFCIHMQSHPRCITLANLQHRGVCFFAIHGTIKYCKTSINIQHYPKGNYFDS